MTEQTYLKEIRTKPAAQSIRTQRTDDRYFDPVEKVIWEFEKIKGLKIGEINISILFGKRQPGELLVLLKDKTGLTYKEISRDLDIFGGLKFSSLREIYRNMKRRGI